MNRFKWAICAAAIAFPTFAGAQIRPGMGGNVDETRTVASAYRAEVQSIVGRLTAELGDAWDDSDASRPSDFYLPNGTLTVAPGESFEGRPAIRTAFEERLGRMRGVLFALEGFDMSDRMAFIRGTMSYEIVPAEGTATRQIMSFTMSLRPFRNGWLIASHTIGGPAVLP